MLSAIDPVRVESREVVRDVTVACGDSGHADAVVRNLEGGGLTASLTAPS
jgi:hypothetical protein